MIERRKFIDELRRNINNSDNKPGVERDAENLKEDWKQVGKDLSSAIKEYEEENERGS